jgi:PAS domain S-box-containing protein
LGIGDHQHPGPFSIVVDEKPGSGSNSVPGAPAGSTAEPARSSHSVQFYEQDEALLERLGEFIGSALGGGSSCIAVATAEHRRMLSERLSASGIHVSAAVDNGRLILLDAAETLQLFMVDGWPDGARFAAIMDGLLAEAALYARRRSRRVAVFGEMVALLWQEGKAEAAIQLEQLWNELAERHSFALLCAYPITGFGQENDEAAFRRICEAHSDVRPCESYGSLTSEAERLLIVSQLQQKAQTLQTELALRRNTEKALRESEAFTRSIVENSADCIKVLDSEGRLVYMSPPGQRALGIEDISSILGRRWTDFWRDGDRERASQAISEAQAGKVGSFQGTLVVGVRTTWWDVKITPILDAGGKVERLIAISREITELKQAQMALVEVEKLAAAGRLAATVAHEINNPLEAVTNFIYLAKTNPELPAEVYRQLEIADQELARVGHIAQQTLGFYRDTSHPRAIDVAELVADVISIYERKLRYKRLVLDGRVAPSLQIVARQGDLKQVLSNVLTNAIDAAPERGRIALRARPATNWRSGVPGIRITVADTGVGMSPEVQSKAFAPFFTTKAEVGTGIGLWITRNILEKQSGFIRCRTSQGPVSGTVMDLFLPFTAGEKTFPGSVCNI